MMLHANARPYTATATKYLIATFSWEQFDHPQYSPDLAPSDFHVFLHLKNSLLADGCTTTTRLKKLLTCGSLHRRHDSKMQGYKNLPRYYECFKNGRKAV
jgi:hypothetical protein